MSPKNKFKYFSILLIIVLCSCKKDKTEFYNLSLDVVPDNSGTLNIARDTLIKANSDIEIRAISNDEYVFVKWEGSINSSENPLVISMKQDESLIANFTKRIYPLNITTEGNGSVSESIIKSKTDYESGTIVRLVATPAEGWAFQNWSGEVNSEDDTLEILIDKEINLTAKFVELETFCVPISLESYSLKSDGDSIKYLDYEFEYDGRFLTEYKKEIDYLKNGEYPPTVFDGTMEYENGNMVSSDYIAGSGVEGAYSFMWNGDELEEFQFLHTQFNGTELFVTDKIEYKSECGLSYYEGRNFQDYDGVTDTSYYYIEYSYENNCLTNGLEINLHKTTFENIPSIFTDVEGMNGLIGGSYVDLISGSGTILNYDPENLRIKKVQNFRTRNSTELNSEDVYTYYNFLDGSKYPQYFTKDRELRSGDSEKESFVVGYRCFQIPGS